MDIENSKNFTELDAIKFINKIEKNFCVDTWEIDGVEIWPIVRNNLFQYLTNDKQKKNKNNVNVIVNKVYILIKQLYVCLKLKIFDRKKSNDLYKNYEVLISSSNITRTILLDNQTLYDTNCDPFYDILQKDYNLKVFILEYFAIDKQNLPRYSNSKCLNTIFLKALLLSKFYLLKKHDLKLSKYEEFKRFLEKNKIPMTLVSENNITKNIVFYNLLSQYLLKILKEKKIKLVLMLCYYSAQNFALSLACHKLNIPCIDIQHGCAGGSLHVMYYSWLNIPKEGFKLLPSGFWCWDREDAQAIKDWAYKENKPIIIKGGRLIRKQWCDTNSALYRSYFEKINRHITNKLNKNMKIILVSLQPGIIYPNWFINIIRNDNSHIWIIREHFISDNNQSNLMNNLKGMGHVLITESKDYPLEFLLTIINLNITYYSSVIIDAEYFSKPSIMLDERYCDMYKKYFDKGCLEYANSEKDLLLKIEKMLNIKYIRSTLDNTLYENGINQIINLM